MTGLVTALALVLALAATRATTGTRGCAGQALPCVEVAACGDDVGVVFKQVPEFQRILARGRTVVTLRWETTLGTDIGLEYTFACP